MKKYIKEETKTNKRQCQVQFEIRESIMEPEKLQRKGFVEQLGFRFQSGEKVYQPRLFVYIILKQLTCVFY